MARKQQSGNNSHKTTAGNQQSGNNSQNIMARYRNDSLSLTVRKQQEMEENHNKIVRNKQSE